MSSRFKSTCCSDALMRRSRCGWVTENPPSRGTSHLLAKFGDMVTVSTDGRVGRIRSSAVRSRSSASRTSGRYFCPASVSLSPRASRSNSFRPRRASSVFTWWLIAPWVWLSSSAAAVKLRVRAAVSNARNAVSEGGTQLGAIDQFLSCPSKHKWFVIGRFLIRSYQKSWRDMAMASATSVSELAQVLGTSQAPTLIDVRRNPTFESAEQLIAGAIRRSPDDVGQWYRALSKQRPVVAYCVHGHEVSQ